MFTRAHVPFLIALVLAGFAAPTYATSIKDKSVHILSFPAWKDHQILAADNRVARLNNEIVLIRQKPGDQSEVVKRVGEQLRDAIADASVVHNLSEDDYISIYLRQYATAPSTMHQIANSLSPDEVADLLSMYLKSKNGT